MAKKFTTTELAIAALGGAVVGGVGVSLLKANSQNTLRPSGAASLPRPTVVRLNSWAYENGPTASALGKQFVRMRGDAQPSDASNKTAYVKQAQPTHALYPPASGVDAILSSCPSTADRKLIASSLEIYIEPWDGETYECTPGGNESSSTLLVYNLFRLARLIRFDRPMPIFQTTNLWDWMLTQRIAYRFAAGIGSEGLPNLVTIGLPPVTLMPEYRQWTGFSDDVGMRAALTLLVHELCHSFTGRMHGCPPNALHPNTAADMSLEYGGAHAAEYWFNRWLAEHSVGNVLSAQQRANAAAVAAFIRSNAFCR